MCFTFGVSHSQPNSSKPALRKNSLDYIIVSNLSIGILTWGSVPVLTLLLLHLSKSSFSQYFKELAAFVTAQKNRSREMIFFASRKWCKITTFIWTVQIFNAFFWKKFLQFGFWRAFARLWLGCKCAVCDFASAKLVLFLEMGKCFFDFFGGGGYTLYI